MPTFEFRCDRCRVDFELLLRRDEQAVCPSCGSTRVEKLISAAAGHAGSRSSSLPIASSCPPADAPPCNPFCCRLNPGQR